MLWLLRCWHRGCLDMPAHPERLRSPLDSPIPLRWPEVLRLPQFGRDPYELTRILELLETTRPDSTWRIMIVRQDSNRIDLYDKRQVMISRRQDVIDLFNDS